mmetsp:Transcript_8299/g.21239  ORF Transcript_8299/g.21239 Transcript_8299/m.21239 type:complete len:274 (+) Transcript_8299:607-1428(+)
MRAGQGGVGNALDRQLGLLRRAPRRVRRGGGHLLLGLLLLHLLAQEARADAGPHLLQRAHLARRGDALRLRVPTLLHARQQTLRRGRSADRRRRGQAREALRDRLAARRPDWHELQVDGAVHRVLRRQAARRAGAPQALQRVQPLRLDGDDLAAGQDQLLREARWRVPEEWHHERQDGKRLHSRGRLLAHRQTSTSASRRGIGLALGRQFLGSSTTMLSYISAQASAAEKGVQQANQRRRPRRAAGTGRRSTQISRTSRTARLQTESIPVIHV